MVKHVLLFQLKDELSPAEKSSITGEIKAKLEALPGKIPGLAAVQVVNTPIPGSNADFLLDCTLTDEASLKGYAIHPDHVAVLDSLIKPNLKNRICMDYVV